MTFVAKDAADDERLATEAAAARERDVRRTFRQAVADTQAATSREELAAAVLANSDTMLERSIPWDIFSEKMIEVTFALSASATAGVSLANEAMYRRRRKMALTDLAPVTQRAIGIVDRQGLEAVVGIADQSRGAARVILKNGLVTGAHVNEIADNLTSAIGLTVRQATTLANYQAALVEEGVSDVRRILLVGKRARKMLKQRGEVIARTEVMTAINAGKTETWQEMVNVGAVASTEVERVWLTAKDERVCPTCGPADGQRQPIGVPFNVGGMMLMYPSAHPNCRCTVILRLTKG